MISFKRNIVMANIQKRLAKISNQKQVRLRDIEVILNFTGYKLDRIRGSHFTFKKDGKDSITFPDHSNLIKRCYIKIIIRKINPLINERM